MTAYRVRLRDCSTLTFDAAEVTTRVDGSLWALTAVPGRRPAALPTLIPALILARGQWVAVWPADAPCPFAEPPAVGSNGAPRILGQALIRDPLGRQEAIASRLADLGECDS